MSTGIRSADLERVRIHVLGHGEFSPIEALNGDWGPELCEDVRFLLVVGMQPRSREKRLFVLRHLVQCPTCRLPGARRGYGDTCLSGPSPEVLAALEVHFGSLEQSG